MQANAGGFDQELQQDRPAFGADGFADADLARPLRHRDEHDVHDADAADEQRQPGDEQPDGGDGAGDSDGTFRRIWSCWLMAKSSGSLGASRRTRRIAQAQFLAGFIELHELLGLDLMSSLGWLRMEPMNCLSGMIDLVVQAVAEKVCPVFPARR